MYYSVTVNFLNPKEHSDFLATNEMPKVYDNHVYLVDRRGNVYIYPLINLRNVKTQAVDSE